MVCLQGRDCCSCGTLAEFTRIFGALQSKQVLVCLCKMHLVTHVETSRKVPDITSITGDAVAFFLWLLCCKHHRKTSWCVARCWSRHQGTKEARVYKYVKSRLSTAYSDMSATLCCVCPPSVCSEGRLTPESDAPSSCFTIKKSVQCKAVPVGWDSILRSGRYWNKRELNRRQYVRFVGGAMFVLIFLGFFRLGTSA